MAPKPSGGRSLLHNTAQINEVIKLITSSFLFISSSRIIAFVLMQKPLEVIMVSDFDKGVPNIIYQVPFLSCGMGFGFRVLPPFDAGHVDCMCFFLKQM